MLRPMVKVQIIGTKLCQTKTVVLLHRLGIIQINAWQETRALSQRRMVHSEEMVQLRERLAYAVSRVEAILATLPTLDPGPALDEAAAALPPDQLLDTIERDLAALKPQIQALTTQREELEAQLGALPRYEVTLRQLLPLVPAVVDLEHYGVTAIWLERGYQLALETIRQQLEAVTGGLYEIISRELDQDILAAILIFSKDNAAAVNELLGQENISQVRLPTEFADQPLEQALSEIRRRLQEIPRQLRDIDHQLMAVAQNWGQRLLSWHTLLPDHLARIDVCAHFGQTDHTFVIEGWVPKDEVVELQQTLKQEVGDEVVVAELPLSAAEQTQAPVAFANLALARPFEPLVGLMALPKPDGFDPTPLMAIFLPLFFGLILGDIAYGLILLALMIYLRRRFKQRPTLASLAEVLMIGSLWGVLFGCLGHRLRPGQYWGRRGRHDC
jgi:V/A-type H+-transporting ATPase subunit I